MKYGIKHDNGTIQAITKFSNDLVGIGFVEISKVKYDEFLNAISNNPYSTYDTTKNTLISDTAALNDYNASQLKKTMRNQLRSISIEMDLMLKLEEDTTDIQIEFDNLKAIYGGE